MENRKYVILALLLLPLFSLAYNDQYTHPALTQEAVKLFQNSYPTPDLSADDIKNIEQGSRDEDVNPRYLHHFYEPHTGIGLWGFISSKQWAEDTKAQGDALAVYMGDLFTHLDDYSWDRGIYEYVYGNKAYGLKTLGHVMHLVEDKAVPEHTRLEAHNPSLYEAWAKKFTTDNVDLAGGLIAQNKNPYEFSTLGEYFNGLAKFSNENFFSPQTVEKYSLPKITNTKIEFSDKDGLPEKFGISTFGHLIRIKTFIDTKTGDVKNNYYVTDTDHKIYTDYWNALAPEAVRYSAGVIKLFFADVEKEKISKELYEKNKGPATKAKEKLLSLVDKVSNALSFSTVSTQSQLAGVPGLLGQTSSGQGEALAREVPIVPENDNEQAEIDRLGVIVQGLLAQLADLRARLTSTVPEDPSLPPLTQVLYDLSGSGQRLTEAGPGAVAADTTATIIEIIKTASSTATTTAEALTPTFTIISPADFSQTFATRTIEFSGTSTNVVRLGTDWQSASTSVATDGAWSLELSGFPDGTSNLNFYAESASGTLAAAQAVEVKVSVVPEETELSLTVADCAQSAISNLCVIPDYGEANLSWTNLGADYEYVIGRESWENYSVEGPPDEYGPTYEDREGWLFESRVATTSDTSMVTDLNTWDSLRSGDRLAVLAYRSGEFVASSSQMVFFEARPLVINEVAWLGTKASPTDEWLELATNINGRVVDLDGIFIQFGNGQEIELSGRIACEEDDFETCLYLVEIGDEMATGESADLVYPQTDPAGLVDDASPDVKIISRNGGVEKILDSLPVNLPAAIALCAEFDDEDGEECYPEQATTTRPSLERITTFDQADADNWAFNQSWRAANGSDRIGNNVAGTPGKKNSASMRSSF